MSENGGRHEYEDRIEIGYFGGVFIFVGILSLMMAAAVAAIVYYEQTEDDLWIPLSMIAVFGLAGACFVLLRGGVVADRAAGAVTRWWGLFITFSGRSTPFEAIRAVTVSCKVGGKPQQVYPVKLASADGDVTLACPLTHAEALTLAEQWARFLGKSIEDVSSGEPVVREVARLDESLRDRLRRQGHLSGWPVAPAGCRVVSSADGDEAVLHVPRKGYSTGQAVGIAGLVAVLLAGIGFVAHASWNMHLTGNLDGGGIAGMALVFAVVTGFSSLGIALVVDAATYSEKITVSPRELAWERRGIFGVERKTILAEQTREVLVTSRHGTDPASGRRERLVARAGQSEISLGETLGPDELVWLRDVILLILTASPTAGAASVERR